MRRPSIFKKTDVTRAALGVLATGLYIARVEINKEGVIAVVPGKPADNVSEIRTNEWDEVLNGTPSNTVR